MINKIINQEEQINVLQSEIQNLKRELSNKNIVIKGLLEQQKRDPLRPHVSS